MIKNDKITLKNKALKASLNMVICKFKDDKGILYIGTIPTIGLATSSRTIDDLTKTIEVMANNFFCFYDTQERLNKRMQSLGWADYKTPPRTIEVTPENLYNKVKIKKIVVDYLFF